MFGNYVTTAFRTLRRQKAYAAINIVGFSIGIACCILMLLYVRDEFTFDGFHSTRDRIFRLVETTTTPEGVERSAYGMGPIGPELSATLPSVETSVRIRDRWGTGRFTVGRGDRRFYEGDYIIAGGSFFDVFDFPLLSGDPRSALSSPGTVVLTESAALKYLGAGDPVGRTLRTERFGDVTVTGLMPDPPMNSHLRFSMIFSHLTLESVGGWKKYIDSWDSDGYANYVVLAPGADPAGVQSRINEIVASHRPPSDKGSVTVSMQPLSDVHFGSADISFERNAGEEGLGPVVIFSIIAILVLAVACINYVNLATARAMKRAREIGMRKVAGARRGHLVAQFLGESTILALAGLVLALVLAEATLPGFNAISGKMLRLDLITNPWTLPVLLAVTVMVGIVSGIYPAWHLAGMNASSILGSRRPSGHSGTFLRKTLVAAQFAVSLAMIAGMLVARDQLRYIATKDLGFDRHRLLVIDINSSATRKSFAAIKTEMEALPDVKEVSVSSRVPGDWKNFAVVDVADPVGGGTRKMAFIGIDQDFLRTFRIGLISGRNLSGLETVDTNAVLVNETAVRAMGWKVPLGGEITVPGSGYPLTGEARDPEARFRAKVVGIVKDFNFTSLHEPVGPIILGHWNNPIQSIDYFTVRLSGEDHRKALKALAAIHRKFDKVTPFEYNFLDDRIGDFYTNDHRSGEIFTISAVLAIAIACLGLLGLVAHTTEQRTKEIGIRKTLGASVPNILALLSRDIAIPAGIAAVVASPVAYFLLDSWLQDFAYRIDIGPSTFIVAALMAAVVGAGTVSFHAIRAARRNPVESLRYE